jgi:hypothetical protein
VLPNRLRRQVESGQGGVSKPRAKVIPGKEKNMRETPEAGGELASSAGTSWLLLAEAREGTQAGGS